MYLRPSGNTLEYFCSTEGQSQDPALATFQTLVCFVMQSLSVGQAGQPSVIPIRPISSFPTSRMLKKYFFLPLYNMQDQIVYFESCQAYSSMRFNTFISLCNQHHRSLHNFQLHPAAETPGSTLFLHCKQVRTMPSGFQGTSPIVLAYV